MNKARWHSESLWLLTGLQLICACVAVNRESIVFQCNTERIGPPASSVHQLHPSDVKVIAALGDSITAGNGIDAHTVAQVLLQKRGQSWSIGGDSSFDEGVVTLATILRKFNPGLVGQSYDQGSWYSTDAHYNMAIPGSKSKDMPTQAQRLIWKLGNDSSIDYDLDWKLVTMFVGGNDLCAFCVNRMQYNASSYVRHIRDALDLLHENVPRMLVSLVAVPDISDIRFYRRKWLCDVLQWTLCSCAKNIRTVSELKALHRAYYCGIRDLVTSGRYDTSEDFTVVLQPHLFRSQIPKLANGSFDLAYIAPDCFHPNERMHQLLAYALWNTLMTPVAEKPLQYIVEQGERHLLCPDEYRPYIATNQNGAFTYLTRSDRPYNAAEPYSTTEPSWQNPRTTTEPLWPASEDNTSSEESRDENRPVRRGRRLS